MGEQARATCDRQFIRFVIFLAASSRGLLYLRVRLCFVGATGFATSTRRSVLRPWADLRLNSLKRGRSVRPLGHTLHRGHTRRANYSRTVAGWLSMESRLYASDPVFYSACCLTQSGVYGPHCCPVVSAYLTVSISRWKVHQANSRQAIGVTSSGRRDDAQPTAFASAAFARLRLFLGCRVCRRSCGCAWTPARDIVTTRIRGTSFSRRRLPIKRGLRRAARSFKARAAPSIPAGWLVVLLRGMRPATGTAAGGLNPSRRGSQAWIEGLAETAIFKGLRPSRRGPPPTSLPALPPPRMAGDSMERIVNGGGGVRVQFRVKRRGGDG